MDGAGSKTPINTEPSGEQLKNLTFATDALNIWLSGIEGEQTNITTQQMNLGHEDVKTVNDGKNLTTGTTHQWVQAQMEADNVPQDSRDNSAIHNQYMEKFWKENFLSNETVTAKHARGVIAYAILSDMRCADAQLWKLRQNVEIPDNYSGNENLYVVLQLRDRLTVGDMKLFWEKINLVEEATSGNASFLTKIGEFYSGLASDKKGEYQKDIADTLNRLYGSHPEIKDQDQRTQLRKLQNALGKNNQTTPEQQSSLDLANLTEEQAKEINDRLNFQKKEDEEVKQAQARNERLVEIYNKNIRDNKHASKILTHVLLANGKRGAEWFNNTELKTFITSNRLDLKSTTIMGDLQSTGYRFTHSDFIALMNNVPFVTGESGKPSIISGVKEFVEMLKRHNADSKIKEYQDDATSLLKAICAGNNLAEGETLANFIRN